MGKINEIKEKVGTFAELIKDFAKDELGCECPDHVFEQIRVLRGEAAPGITNLAIVVGERLLIMIPEYEKIDPFDFEMPRIILSGVTYRDSIGLNRFRLVLGTDVPAEHREKISNELTKYDENVEVHYLD